MKIYPDACILKNEPSIMMVGGGSERSNTEIHRNISKSDLKHHYYGRAEYGSKKTAYLFFPEDIEKAREIGFSIFKSRQKENANHIERYWRYIERKTFENDYLERWEKSAPEVNIASFETSVSYPVDELLRKHLGLKITDQNKIIYMQKNFEFSVGGDTVAILFVGDHIKIIGFDHGEEKYFMNWLKWVCAYLDLNKKDK